MSEFLTVAEVAEIVRLSKAAVYNLVNGGLLPHVRLGGAIRIRRADLDAMLAQQSRGDSFAPVVTPAEGPPGLYSPGRDGEGEGTTPSGPSAP